MEIPPTQLSGEYFSSRVQKVVQLQKQWTGWVAPERLSRTPLKEPARRFPAAQRATVVSRNRSKPFAFGRTTSPSRESFVVAQSTSTFTVDPLRRPGSAAVHQSLSERGNCSPTRKPHRRPQSATPARSCTVSHVEFEGAGEDKVDEDTARWSSFGVSEAEVVELSALCDAVSSLVSPSTSNGEGTSTANLAKGEANNRRWTVEVALATLEALAKIFEGHPLLGFALRAVVEVVPRGVYSNAFPYLAEASPPPSSTGTPSGAPRSSGLCSLWIDWLLSRGDQWSSIGVPLGAVTTVFGAAREKSLAQKRCAETLGAKLFGADVAHGDSISAAEIKAQEDAAVTASLAALTPVERRKLLQSHFVAWSEETAKLRRFRKVIKVVVRAERKHPLSLAFLQWRSVTQLSLADRKASHSERLHYVVEDNEQRMRLMAKEIHELKRARDTALGRIDKLIDDSKVVKEAVKDIHDGMVIDFRKPLYSISSEMGTSGRRRIPEPLVKGVIFFEQQPTLPVVGRSAASFAVEGGQQQQFQAHRGPTGAPLLPIEYRYDCGNERPVEGVAIPHSERFRSFYTVSVEGFTSSQLPQQQQSSDSLLQWTNQQVVAACMTLMTSGVRSGQQEPVASSPSSLGGSPTARSPTLRPSPAPGLVLRGGAAKGAPRGHGGAVPQRILSFQDFGEAGEHYQAYLSEWNAQLDRWDAHVADLSAATEVSSNTLLDTESCSCVVTFGSASAKPSVCMACHLRKAADARRYPYVYVLLMLRACPNLVDLHLRAFEGRRVEERVASFLSHKRVTMSDVLPLLETFGLCQHVSLEMLEGVPPTASAASAVQGTVPPACDAAHRMVLARLRCYSELSAEFEQLWRATSDVKHGLPQNRSMTLADLVLQFDGPSHSTEVVAKEILEWVRSVFLAGDGPSATADPSEAVPAVASSTTSTKQRGDLWGLLRSRDSAGGIVQGLRKGSTEGSGHAPPPSDASGSPLNAVDNLSTSFGDGLQLLWFLVQRLTPPNVPPMLHLRPDVGDAGKTAPYPLQLNQGMEPHSLTEQQPDVSSGEQVFAGGELESTLNAQHGAPVEGARVDCRNMTSQQLARVLCDTLRDQFGCHVPAALYDRLGDATPSAKMLFLTSLYNRIHAVPETGASATTTNALASNSAHRHASQLPSSPPAAAVTAKSTTATKSAGKHAQGANARLSDPVMVQASKASGTTYPDVCGSLLGAIDSASGIPSVDDSLAVCKCCTVQEATDVAALLQASNQILFLTFVKYSAFAAPALRAPQEPTGSTFGGGAALGLSFLGVEQLARDLCYGYQQMPSLAQCATKSPEEFASVLLATRKSFADVCGVAICEASSGGGPAPSDLGTHLFKSGLQVECAQFGEWLLRFAKALPESIFFTLQKQLIKRGKKEHDPALRFSPTPSTFMAIGPEDTAEGAALSQAARVAIFVELLDSCHKEGLLVLAAPTSLQCAVPSPVVAAHHQLASKGKRDAAPPRDIVASVLIDVATLRAAAVVPHVFRERWGAVVSMFSAYSSRIDSQSNDSDDEDDAHRRQQLSRTYNSVWALVEERRMSREQFLQWIRTTSLVSRSAAPLRRRSSGADVESPSPAAAAAQDTTTARLLAIGMGVETASYAQVSPLRGIVSWSSSAGNNVAGGGGASTSGAKKAPPRAASRLPKSTATKETDYSALLRTRGCRAEIIGSLPESMALLTFDMVCLCRSSADATALDKLLLESGTQKKQRRGDKERHASPTNPSSAFTSEPDSTLHHGTLGVAGFCEVLSMLCLQVIPFPWLSLASRTALLLELLSAPNPTTQV